MNRIREILNKRHSFDFKFNGKMILSKDIDEMEKEIWEFIESFIPEKKITHASVFVDLADAYGNENYNKCVDKIKSDIQKAKEKNNEDKQG